ncbi:putative ubiquinone biosynthesis monooxygenase [Blomia tropicalis]|nr:putative ubiquinone biosynthesis monooxygenase [Blomia tropicalis]
MLLLRFYPRNLGLSKRYFSHKSAILYSQNKINDTDLQTEQIHSSYDIIINGGGIVGFSFLAAIKTLPYLSTRKVLLIEQQPEPKFPPKIAQTKRIFGNRVSAITEASKQFFDSIGVWDELKRDAKQVDAMHVWTDHYRNAVHFENLDSTSSNGMWPTCYIVENSKMIRALYEKINEIMIDQIQVRYGTTVCDIEQITSIPSFRDDQTSEIELKLKDNENETLRTKLLIGCDGFKSLVRTKSDLPYYNFDINQMGIVGTLEITSPYPNNSVAFQRFVGDHLVLALLPLDEYHSSFVLSCRREDLKSWMDLSDEEFTHRFQRELIKEQRKSTIDRALSEIGNKIQSQPSNLFQHQTPPIVNATIAGSRAAFPLGFGTTAPRLVGTIQARNFMNRDIAPHRVHPLAGQGLNLGLGDAAELAYQIETCLSNGFNPFGFTADSSESLSDSLRQFERNRIAKLIPMMGAIQSVQTMMSWTPASALSILDSLPWVKTQMVKFANSR